MKGGRPQPAAVGAHPSPAYMDELRALRGTTPSRFDPFELQATHLTLSTDSRLELKPAETSGAVFAGRGVCSGAVVEKGVRGWAADWKSGVVFCFQSPSVNYLPHGGLLEARHSAHFYLARSDTSPATARLHAVSVCSERLPGGRPVLRYLARADLDTPEPACRADLRFQAYTGVVRVEGVASACEP